MSLFTKNVEPDLCSFVIFDSKSKTYGLPMLEKNAEVLIRELVTTFKKPEQQAQNHLFINAEDYSLFKNAEYDRRSGEFKTVSLEHIVNLHDLKARIPLAKPLNLVQDSGLGIDPT